ncbi:TnsD family transposase [Mesobacillus jeotgali]|uniref:TnsD family transposase n=1 Tax=Mesobacillus jeotgali TaxID=129985 RepID=A0ABY9VQ98_9BACI|nr:TnsD family transposase [Mesobacillus jeotgali]WNF23161.1 TnsD family transposase [Mesobacillus jeotgali]
MLRWFPRIHEDESLYSIFARYFIQSPHLSIREALHELFNDSRAVLTPDFPSNLGVLFNQFSLFSNINLDEFICKHTPLNYFTTFIGEEQFEKVFNEIRNPKRKNVQMLTGLVASTVKETRFFKYCPLCFEHDQKTYGESFWRVSHQLPGVLICQMHHSVLHYSSVKYRYRNAELHTPNVHNCKPSEKSMCIMNEDFTKDELTLLIKVAIYSKQLLLNREKYNDSQLTKKYKEFLREKGYLTSGGNVKQSHLYSAFVSFYGLKILSALQSIPTSEENTCWLKSIARKHKKSFHPLRHILFLMFLGKTVTDLSTPDDNSPFGNGPYPCLNPAAVHHKELVVSQLSIKRCTDTGYPIGTFTCKCGFQYTRLGPDKKAEDKYNYRYVRCYGEVWQDKLIDYVDNKKYSFRKIAKILEVDVGTVIKYYKTPKKQSSEQGVNEISKELYRSVWIKTMGENPTWTKTQIRKSNPKEYAWLYRNDKEWLNCNSPKKFINQSPKNARVDWGSRDLDTLLLLKKFLLTINHKSRPKRITKRYLALAIDKLSLIEKHLIKLPLSKLFIESLVESPIEYRERLEAWKKEKI